jgi:hypothetical protein
VIFFPYPSGRVLNTDSITRVLVSQEVGRTRCCCGRIGDDGGRKKGEEPDDEANNLIAD